MLPITVRGGTDAGRALPAGPTRESDGRWEGSSHVMGPLTHRRLRRQVTALIDGQLPPGAAARVRRHLELCPDCNRDAELICLIKRSLRRRPERAIDLGATRLRRWAVGLAGQR